MPLRAGLFLVITFASYPFGGNPAFVLSDPGDASDDTLTGMCELLHTEVIAVIDGLADREPRLRFFTTGGPHSGAGHATLAAAHVALRQAVARQEVTFRLSNGDRRVARATGELIAVSFPSMAASPVDRISEMEDALGARPIETWFSAFGYVGIFKDAGTIAAMQPDMARVGAFDRTAVIATAPSGDASDIVIRVFAPNAGLPEDPVCGTAHRIIVPYWAERMGKTSLHSRQLSPRGGDLWCEIAGEDVTIAGESCLVIAGTAELPDR